MNKLFKTYGGSLLLVAFLFVSIGAQSQAKYMLKGVVSTLENNELLPGSSILVKGTTRGTATDFDGNFAIEVSEGEKIIVSFVGYDEQEIAITGQKSEEVKLKMSVGQSLSDVVVVGYGVQKRSHLTGSVSKMDDANFAEAPVSRADQALVGKLSGVDIATTDASAGASPKILIRGVSSINTSTDPLIVVDGFPIPGDLSSVDMNDVQSIEVLKDAASAAIYGSRGANGVIMITTKSGKKGKLSFDVNVISGVKSAFKRDDLYSTPSEWVDKLNAQGIPLNTQVNKMMELGTATDWQDVIFRTGGFQKYQVGASGGGEWGNFYFGGSYQSDKGVVLTDQFDKFSLRGNINAKLSERVEAGIQISGSSSKSRVVAVGLQDALRNQPWLPLYHTEQTLAFLAANNLPLTSPNYGSVLGRPIQVGDVAHESDFGTSLLQLTNNNSAYAKVMDRDNSYRNIEMYANAY
ncbi:MAG: hypothetical protein RIS47_2182, partial [Bacteroidota bacterium]